MLLIMLLNKPQLSIPLKWKYSCSFQELAFFFEKLRIKLGRKSKNCHE